MLILVFQHLADQIPNAVYRTNRQSVHVYQVLLEMFQIVDTNALSIMNVHTI